MFRAHCSSADLVSKLTYTGSCRFGRRVTGIPPEFQTVRTISLVNDESLLVGETQAKNICDMQRMELQIKQKKIWVTPTMFEVKIESIDILWFVY